MFRIKVVACVLAVGATVLVSCGGAEVDERVDIVTTLPASGSTTMPDLDPTDPLLAGIDPCALVTTKEAGEALGTTVDTGVPSLQGDSVMCTFSANALDHTGDQVTVQVFGGARFDDVSAGAATSTVYNYTPIEGLGDAALVQSYKVNIGQSTTGDVVLVKRGDHMLQFGIASLTMTHTQAIDAQKRLAAQALARLTP